MGLNIHDIESLTCGRDLKKKQWTLGRLTDMGKSFYSF